MKAMILAAGLGTRLRPLTDTLPKALLPIAGRPMLEHVIRRLKRFGVDAIIINVHHHPQQIIDFVREKNDFGIRIEVSVEDELLDTGGGLQRAAWFFDDGAPFLVHNVDVLTDLDLGAMLEQHRQSGALATLAVRQRQTSRYLLFRRDDLQLAGWHSTKTGEMRWASQPVEEPLFLSFMGIHALSPAILPRLDQASPFPILPAYLRLAAAGQPIRGFRADSCRWLDLGRPENLSQVEHVFDADFLAKL